VYSLLNKDARTIVSELLARPYRVVHIAAHGEPGPDGGVVLSGNAYLSAKEIRSMRVVPELVFLNCCHLAARTPELALAGASYDRASFAANAADSLIRVGVRCVVAAGWAVDDARASHFAEALYDSLLAGKP